MLLLLLLQIPEVKSAADVASIFDQKPKDESLKINEEDNDEVRQLKTNFNVLQSEITTLRALLKEQKQQPTRYVDTNILDDILYTFLYITRLGGFHSNKYIVEYYYFLILRITCILSPNISPSIDPSLVV